MKTPWYLQRRAGDTDELQQKSTRLGCRVSKLHAKQFFEIEVKKPLLISNHPTHSESLLPFSQTTDTQDIERLANQIKGKLLSAMTKLWGSSELDSTSCPVVPVSTSPTSTSVSTCCGSKTTHSTQANCALNTSMEASKPLRLHHLNLLKQYLLFVTHADNMDYTIVSDQSQHCLQLSIPHSDIIDSRHYQQARVSDTRNSNSGINTITAARVGADLIEYHVHQKSQMRQTLTDRRMHGKHSLNMEALHIRTPTVTKEAVSEHIRTRRQTKLVKLSSSDTRTHISLLSRLSRPKRRSTRRFGHKKAWDCNGSMAWADDSDEQEDSDEGRIQCICDTPYEESGLMIQCDDCLFWLHMDCLGIDQKATKDTFRCPSCAIAFGQSCNPRMNSVAWRLAACRESERVAAIRRESTSDEEDEVCENEGKTPLMIAEDNYGTDVNSDMEWSRCESTSSTSISGLMDIQTVLSETESPSEVSTPDHVFCGIDPFEHVTEECTDGLVLNSNSLEWMYRMAYIESLDAVKNRVFTANASDVFLYENLEKDTFIAPTSPAARFTPDTLPSSICIQELKEFSFDSGPFWRQVR